MTKLTADRIPEMAPKPKRKSHKRKLGLLTRRKLRKTVSMRFDVKTVNHLNKLLIRSHEAINTKISRTDIIEALLQDASNNQTNTYLKNILLELGKS